MDKNLSKNVQMQYLRPKQLEEAAKAFPVVYVPFGLIEWHGRHLPLGNDALKAHAILVKCAEKFGGVVYPPLFFPHTQWEMQPEAHEWKIPMVTDLFDRLKKTGFRVIIGVSGHNIKTQIEMINEALKPVIADGTVAGIGLWEMTLSYGEESASDHAAKWETSNMMYLYPDLVDMKELGKKSLAPDMEPPDGIGGLDPRKYASAKVGKRNVELCADAIGLKARELLESLPEDQRAFNLETVSPEHWWEI